MLFETLRIKLVTERTGSVDDLLANPRICTAIRFLELRGRFLSSSMPRNDEEQLSLIQKFLPEMVGLRKVSISQVNLSKAFLDTFLGIAANIPLQIGLTWNIYPYSVIPIPHKPLQISHLHISATFRDPSREFYRLIFRASATTLTRLSIKSDRNGLIGLTDINLPFLRDLDLFIALENELSKTSAAAFLTTQTAIRKLVLRGRIFPLPPLPPNALPNLRELKASSEMVNRLVPGRPVKEIEVSSQGRDQDWFGEEVGQSTARVRMLRVHLDTAILATRMVNRMVTILPFLENLWLPVSDDVSGPFTRLSDLGSSFPSGIPQCCRNPHLTQVPQVPTRQSDSS